MKFKKVKTLLSDKSRWTKGTLQRNKYGHPVKSDKSACKFCLLGALTNIYGKDYKALSEARQAVADSLAELFPAWGHNIIGFNDSKSTTHEDVVKVIKKANI